MSSIPTPNEISALIAAVCLAFTYYSLRGVFHPKENSAYFWFVRAITVFVVVGFLRLAMWDLVIATLTWMQPSSYSFARYVGNMANTLFNASMAYVTFAAQMGLLAVVPKNERSDWSVFSVWSYPIRPRDRLARIAAFIRFKLFG